MFPVLPQPSASEAVTSSYGRLLMEQLSNASTYTGVVNVDWIADISVLKSGRTVRIDHLFPDTVTSSAASVVTAIRLKLFDHSPPPDNISPLEKRLAELATLHPGWDGGSAETPNRLSLLSASMFLALCREISMTPAGVVPSAEGGVAVTFRAGRVYADVEFFNDGDILAAVDSGGGQPNIWPVSATAEDFRSALNELRTHLSV